MNPTHYLSNYTLVVSDRPEPIIRAFAVAGVLDISIPTAQMTNWIARQTTHYDNTFEYWQPYGLLPDGSVFIHPWARGAFGYFAGLAGVTNAHILSVDPAVWYHNIVERVTAAGADQWTIAAAEMARDQTNPEWLGGTVGEFYRDVRTAIGQRAILTTPDQIRRRRKTAAKQAAEIRAWRLEQAERLGVNPSDLDT